MADDIPTPAAARAASDHRAPRAARQAQGRGAARRLGGVGPAPARAGQAHRARAHRPAARPRHVRRARHARPPPGARLRHRAEPSAHRRCRHRLGRGRRPQGLRVLAGLHDLRRRARRGVRREDPQGDGPRRVGRRAARRAQRRRRRAHPRGCGLARVVRRDLLPQRQVVGSDPADQCRARSVRGRCRLLAGDDRLHLHGEGHVEHVHHRARRHQDRDRRRRHAGRARRRDDPRDEVGRRDVRRRRRAVVPRAGALPPVVPAVEQPRGSAALRDRPTIPSAAATGSSISSPTRPTARTT